MASLFFALVMYAIGLAVGTTLDLDDSEKRTASEEDWDYCIEQKQKNETCVVLVFPMEVRDER